MRIGVITAGRSPEPLAPLMTEVVELLTEWDMEVELIQAEQEPTDVCRLAPVCNLYVLESDAQLALSLAGALQMVGARILNPYAATAACRDKLLATRILRNARVPVPDTFAAARASMLAPLLGEGPLVVMPDHGSAGRRVQVIRDPGELERVPANGNVVFGQRYHVPDGCARTIYCIGGQVFGVKRVFPARTLEERLAEPIALDRELHEIAVACGRAFGMQLYCLDVIVSGDRPYVFDVSSFPSFDGVPDAALRLADFIYASVEAAPGSGRLAPFAKGAVL
jgi:ribosomal protein S6--L-glutamate ligase